MDSCSVMEPQYRPFYKRQEKSRSFLEFFHRSYIFINMGRKLKYKSKEEQLEAKRKWRREYYYRNKEQICENYMRKYYERKQKTMQSV